MDFIAQAERERQKGLEEVLSFISLRSDAESVYCTALQRLATMKMTQFTEKYPQSQR